MEFKNGKFKEVSTIVSPNGDVYVGEIVSGKPNGLGTLIIRRFVIYGETKVTKYVGEFKDGKFHGQGTLTYYYDEKSVGEWKDGRMWNGTKSM